MTISKDHNFSHLKVAVVHEWLVTRAGSEKVLEEILALFPQADLFAIVSFLPPGQDDLIKGRKVTTSFIQRMPWAATRHRAYIPLMPIAVEQFDLSSYDLVISSSHAVAKGVITGPNQVHVSYIHSPMRYAWDLQHTYLAESGLARGFKSGLARILLHYLRIWDYRTACGVDRMIANSAFIARRISKIYGRKADVVWPPIDVKNFKYTETKDNFYLAASRMVPYKRIPLIVEAFAKMPDCKLVVIGDGPDMKAVREAAGPNVEILGYQSDEVLRDHMSRAKAFVFAAEEDFGIMPVEVQACGTPIIAYGRGGTLETVRGPESDKPTGVFFAQQTQDSIIKAVRKFESMGTKILPQNCLENATRFNLARFQDEFLGIVGDEIERLGLRFGAEDEAV
jgi:glycosyltransferase involved in cell wall biosynthesis